MQSPKHCPTNQQQHLPDLDWFTSGQVHHLQRTLTVSSLTGLSGKKYANRWIQCKITTTTTTTTTTTKTTNCVFFVQLAYFLLITPGKARYFKEEPLKIAG